ncbi:phage tail protein [Bartonella raoultii]|uniref:Phage tail protein n=1 Tax=Bartonella raoultii TaxID=1457020 RepID=A0ABS7I887_9HYPH|nr:phage tail protein [Bartonella raoultii]MBX4335523.1 phage tail protein [Bartonella raoultii]MBX4335617.1 phage tail protein [Bartonella raoultii]
MSTVYDWSLKALENGNADALINWSEGQPPSTVNNSARMMMQRIKEYLLDTGGVIESVFVYDEGQSTTSVHLQSRLAYPAYRDGLHLRFVSRGHNRGATRVSVNTLTSQPVYKATDKGLSLLSGGEFQEGCVYSLVYDEALSGWQVLNPTRDPVPASKTLPTGLIGPFAMRHLPAGWLLCDGQAYSRLHYRSLFSKIGTSWGEGDGVRTFNVPDLRGMFLRGLDEGRNVDPWRSFASQQEHSLKAHDHFIGSIAPHSLASRKKRDVSSSDALKRSKRSLDSDEECLGLSGDALEKCNQEFDERAGVPAAPEVPFWFTESDKPPRLPWFIRSPFANFLISSTPLQEGLDRLAPHEHRFLIDSFGGEETRPVNVSVVFGIKT